MSQENVEAIRALHDAFDRGDYHTALSALAPDIEWHAPPGVTIGEEVYCGRAEVQRGFALWLDAWETHRFEPTEIRGHGDHVFVTGNQIGRGRGSGVEVKLQTFHVYKLRDGLVTEMRAFDERTEALEAAGLSDWAMSQENVEIVRKAFTASDQGDIEAVLRLCDEDIVITQPPELPGAPAVQHGHRGVVEAFAIWPEQWEGYRIEILKIADAPGDKVFVTTRTRGRGKQSGVEVHMEFSFVFTIREAKISVWQLFMREDQALEAAGLSD